VGATYVVTLREGFEAALLLGIVYAYLDKIGGRVHYRYVTTGAVLGLLASVAAGVAVSLASGPLLDLGPDLIATAVVFAAVVLLTWHGWWMRRHARELTGDVQARIAQAQATQRLWLVGMIAFTGVFREGAETVLLLWGLLTQAASASGYDGAVGGVLGVATAGALGWAIFRGSRRVSLGRFFTATSLVLMLVAAGLCSTGTGKLQGLGWLPPSEALWDTSGLLSDTSLLGGFVAGLAGYRARPTPLEVAAWLAYLALATPLLFGLRWRARRALPVPPR